VVLPVVADADTLFGATTRGLLIHLDYQGLIRLHWSALLLDELSRALVDTGRKSDWAAALVHELLMRSSLPQAEIPTADVQAQFHAVAGAMRSAKDMHVAACARALRTQNYYPNAKVVSLVTRNVRDFGVKKLAALGIVVERPDPFLYNLVREDPQGVVQAFTAFRLTLRSGPSAEQLLDKLAADGQKDTATALRNWFSSGLINEV
jgi:hypothetical protein